MVEVGQRMMKSERDSRVLEAVVPENQASVEAELLQLEVLHLKPGLPERLQKESKLSLVQRSSHQGKTQKGRRKSWSNKTRKSF